MNIAFTYEEDTLLANGSIAYKTETELPPNAIPGPFPVLHEFQAAQANEARDGWNVVEDYRGAWVVDADDNPVRITEIGPLPAGCRVRRDSDPDVVAEKLATAVAAAQASLLSKRKSVEYGGFMLDGQRWDSEEKDELRLNSMMTMMEKMGVSEFPGWKINADTFITLTAQIAMRAAVAMMQHYNACFVAEEAKKAELHALLSADEVREWLATRLDAGWPE